MATDQITLIYELHNDVRRLYRGNRGVPEEWRKRLDELERRAIEARVKTQN